MALRNRYPNKKYIEELEVARKGYAALGFDTVPFHPGTKVTTIDKWQSRESDDMWRGQPPDSNIGIRMGGHLRLGVIDCDDKACPGTYYRVSQYLRKLGYEPGDYSVVQTASGNGRHIYVKLDASLEKNWYNLAKSYGAGEVRVGSGALVIAPPSIVAGMQYSLIAGSFENIPTIPLSVILGLLPAVEPLHNPAVWLPSTSIATTLPRLAQDLLAGKSKPEYQSRSEADQALILSLINAGHTFESILELFTNNPGQGKFLEIHKRIPEAAILYLSRSYQAAYVYATTYESPGRALARAAIEWAVSVPWPGRTGSYDRAIFIAHATIAMNAGRTQYAASSRDLAELANVTHRAASNATLRLIRRGLLRRISPGYRDKAAEYRMMWNAQGFPLPHREKSIGEWVNLHSLDAFHRLALGKASVEIYQILEGGPLSAKEIAAKTGRNVTTVRRHLNRMSSVMDFSAGESFAMVVKKDGIWHRQDADLDVVAKSYGTDGAGQRRRERHKQEREGRKVLFQTHSQAESEVETTDQ